MSLGQHEQSLCRAIGFLHRRHKRLRLFDRRIGAAAEIKLEGDFTWPLNWHRHIGKLVT